MKSIFLSFCFVILSSFAVMAKDLTLKCDTDPLATGYTIEMSEDLGATWTEVSNSPNPQATITVAEDGMKIFRYTAYNGTAKIYRYASGSWYNGTFKPPSTPINAGME